VAISLFDNVSPAIEMVECGLWMGMDVCVPLAGIGGLNLLNMHIHLLFRQDLQDIQDERHAKHNPRNPSNSTNQIVLLFRDGNELEIIQQVLKPFAGLAQVCVMPES
jgi:hypothetical protein